MKKSLFLALVLFSFAALANDAEDTSLLRRILLPYSHCRVVRNSGNIDTFIGTEQVQATYDPSSGYSESTIRKVKGGQNIKSEAFPKILDGLQGDNVCEAIVTQIGPDEKAGHILIKSQRSSGRPEQDDFMQCTLTPTEKWSHSTSCQGTIPVSLFMTIMEELQSLKKDI